MHLHTGLLDPQGILNATGSWALLIVAAMAFAETGLLVGFFLPGDTLLFFTGVLTLTGHIPQPLWMIIIVVAIAASLGDQLGYVIGRRTGPRIFERRESGLFSHASVVRTERFFQRFGPAAVMLARFVAVVRTFAPVAAGVGKMRWGVFTAYNVVGAFVWSTAVILLGYWLGHIPFVVTFVSSYLDIILIGIVVISVVPVLVRAVTLAVRRRRAARSTAAE